MPKNLNIRIEGNIRPTSIHTLHGHRKARAKNLHMQFVAVACKVCSGDVFMFLSRDETVAPDFS